MSKFEKKLARLKKSMDDGYELIVADEPAKLQVTFITFKVTNGKESKKCLTVKWLDLKELIKNEALHSKYIELSNQRARASREMMEVLKEAMRRK